MYGDSIQDIDKDSIKGLAKTTVYVTINGAEKRRIDILLSKDVAEKLFAEASRIYGRGRGGVSLLIETLLREYFKNRSIELPSSFGKSVREVFLQVLRKIAEYRNDSVEDILDVPEKELTRAISEVRGSDKRTVKKWIGIFIQNNLLEYIGGFPPQRVFKVKPKVYNHFASEDHDL